VNTALRYAAEFEEGPLRGLSYETFVAAVIFVVVAIALVVFWVWGIIDAAKTPDDAWVGARHSKALWLVLMVMFWPFATLLYVIWPRPLVKGVAAMGGGPWTNPDHLVDSSPNR
jgi:hypothetical protein